MNQHYMGNLLMVSNHSSDTAYAWWLMEHFWKAQAELFKKAGKKAFLAYPEITTLSETITNSPIEPVELTIPWRSREEAVKVQRFLKDNNISYIYFTDQPYFNFKYAMMRRSGVKRIDIHDHTPGDRPPVGGVKGALKATRNKIPWLTADKIFCVSDLMRQRNIANGRIPAYKCIVVQNGIEPVICDTNRAADLRETLGVNPKSLLVVTTGRAHPYKRFDFIIQCANSLRKRAPELDIVFLLVGDGPAMSKLQLMVRQLGLDNSIRLLGFRDDVHDLLCISDIALHAALGEGFSLSIIEYMSAGLPVLVPDIPSVCQAITHDLTGLIYPKDAVEAVTSYIQTLATDPEKRRAMSNAAKEEADSRYTLNECTNKFLQAIESEYQFIK